MIQFYEINPDYIDYLANFAPHIFHNKQKNQNNSRKYIGIVLSINNFDYFVPLSSFKEKHKNNCKNTKNRTNPSKTECSTNSTAE